MYIKREKSTRGKKLKPRVQIKAVISLMPSSEGIIAFCIKCLKFLGSFQNGQARLDGVRLESCHPNRAVEWKVREDQV